METAQRQRKLRKGFKKISEEFPRLEKRSFINVRHKGSPNMIIHKCYLISLSF